jgi:DNA-binding MarR family transcriptional regulator
MAVASRDEHIADIEYAVAELVRRLVATRPRHPGVAALDRSAYLILHEVLRAPDPLTIQALARRLHVDLSTMSRQITAMERKALIDRVPAANDPRAHWVTATASGRRGFESMRAARQAVYQEILRDWSRADQEQLAVALQRLNQSIREFQEQGDARDAPAN